MVIQTFVSLSRTVAPHDFVKIHRFAFEHHLQRPSLLPMSGVVSPKLLLGQSCARKSSRAAFRPARRYADRKPSTNMTTVCAIQVARDDTSTGNVRNGNNVETNEKYEWKQRVACVAEREKHRTQSLSLEWCLQCHLMRTSEFTCLNVKQNAKMPRMTPIAKMTFLSCHSLSCRSDTFSRTMSCRISHDDKP